jgi:hypothetical protein
MAEIAGLKLITPSSVTTGGGATASGTGKTTFTGLTTTGSISLEGIFSATYDNYLLVIGSLEGTGGSLLCRLRVGGSDASGGDYARQQIDAEITTVSGSRSTGQTSTRIGNASAASTYSGNHVYVYGPNLAQPTAFRSVSCYHDGGARILDYASTHSLSTSYTALTLFGSGATSPGTAGTIQVFGLSQ